MGCFILPLPIFPGGPNLSQGLQEADVDGDQPWESLIRKLQPFNEELELGSSTGVLHNVAQLPPAQHVDIVLPKEWVCKDQKGNVSKSRPLPEFLVEFGISIIPLCQKLNSVGGRKHLERVSQHLGLCNCEQGV